MDERWAGALALLPDYAAQHMLLSMAALALGIAISLPVAVLSSRRPRLRFIALATASLAQTIPGLALLALFYPLLLALSALTMRAFGFAIPALGFLPSLLALTIYSMLPILRNGVTGLDGVDHDYIEAADGVGMTPGQRLARVELPLAAPVIMAGIRTAAVWTIGIATLSTAVGQTSLGNYIFSGLQTENWVYVLTGCIAVVALAMFVDQVLALIEAGVALRDRRRIVAGIVALVVATAAAAAPLVTGRGADYALGAKNFSEQYILAGLMASRIEAEGPRVRLKEGLGSAVIFRALAGNEIDAYVDYSGTLWTNVMERRDVPSRAVMLEELTRFMREKYGVTVLGSLGFENAYGLAMRTARTAALGVRTISELAPQSPKLTLGSDLEFLSRPEWTSLRDTYHLAFREERSFNPTFMYRALQDGLVDVISAFTSDGRLAGDKLIVLDDDKHAIPSYDAVILLAPKRANDEVLRRALTPLVGAISVETMRQANFMIDRDTDKASLADAVRFLAANLKQPAPPAGKN
jgi:osmoprotectant transport system permease protein